MNTSRILITSAAGKTGMATALDLLERRFPVRALVRQDDHRAQRLRDAGAEILVGDMGDFGDMQRAMQGVQRAYFCAPMAANGLHYGMVFAAAAHEARLEHVVVMSQWLADPSNPSLGTREVWLTERILGLLPNLPTTVVNPGWFADNHFLVLEPIAQLGLLPMPLGDGRNAPPSNEDIGRVVAAILADPSGHAGRTYRPTGPTLMSPQVIATALGDALGRRVRYMNISERMFLKAMRANGGFPHFAQTQLRHYTREYRDDAFGTGGTTDTVRALTGREPEDFATIARRYVAERPEAQRSLFKRLRAVGNFLRLVLTRPLDMARLEREREHVLLRDPSYTTQADDWNRTHLGSGSYGVESGVIDTHGAASRKSQRPDSHSFGARAIQEVHRA